ncbi:MAG: hypothetical protein JJU15_16205 [Pararhodobacter sp.]|nr:hypothetical protein [Pararhodobacter sp.]
MQAFDALPCELRHWLHDAALPWSAGSVRKVWEKALKQARGDRGGALAALDGIEARLIARDARRIWGAGHPASGDGFAAGQEPGAGGNCPAA